MVSVCRERSVGAERKYESSSGRLEVSIRTNNPWCSHEGMHPLSLEINVVHIMSSPSECERLISVIQGFTTIQVVEEGAGNPKNIKPSEVYSSYSTINAFWSDTTAMDNLRGADITNSSIAGSTETIGYNTQANEVRGGHSVHSTSSESYDTTRLGVTP